MEAFWQNAQRMLQPYEPIERMLDPGMETRERFLLDRIERERGDTPVVLVDHYAIVCHARTTDAALPFSKRTSMRTDGTRDALTASRHVPHRR